MLEDADLHYACGLLYLWSLLHDRAKKEGSCSPAGECTMCRGPHNAETKQKNQVILHPTRMSIVYGFMHH